MGGSFVYYHPMQVRLAKRNRTIEMPLPGVSMSQRHLSEGKYGWSLSRGNRFTRMSDYALLLIKLTGLNALLG